MHRKNKLFWPVLFVLVMIAALTAACGKKDEGPAQGQTGFPEPTASAPVAGQAGVASISDNPRFFTQQDLLPASDPVKDLDRLIRPILVKIFGGAKLTEQSDTPITELDGEVILNSMKYTVRRLLDGPAGDELHQALKEDGHFSRTPCLGAKPVHGSKMVLMSFSKSTSLGGYSLVLGVDLVEQVIIIKSYKLGSKYDRLM